LILGDQEQRQKNLGSSDAEIYKVHKEIARLKATYPTELSRNLFMDREAVEKCVAWLMKEKAVLRLVLAPQILDARIAYRIHYFWSIGIKGFYVFSRMKWLVQNPECYWGRRPIQEEKIEDGGN